MNGRRITVVSATAGAAIAIAGCGGTTAAPANPAAPPAGVSTGNEAPAAHNTADVNFVKSMIPHHSQAIQMAQLAADRASSQQVKDLAATISQAQGPEIEQMQGILRNWGLPPEPTNPGGMAGMGNGGGMAGMPGMMSDQQMQQMQGAKGAAFDQMFLQMMTQHHSGAIQMSETELRDGQSAEAKGLAQMIIDAQRAEIDQMRELMQTS